MLGGDRLRFVDITVFLGIDSKLQWGRYVQTLADRLSSAEYAVWKIRQITDKSTGKLILWLLFLSVLWLFSQRCIILCIVMSKS